MDWLALGVRLGSGCWMDVPCLQRLSWCVSFQPPHCTATLWCHQALFLSASLVDGMLTQCSFKIAFLWLQMNFSFHVFISHLYCVVLCSSAGQVVFTLRLSGSGRWMVYSSVQSLSCVRLFATPLTAACQASLSITNSQSLLKLMSIESVMPSNHLILYCPFLLPPSTFPSTRVFSNESVLRIRWPKYWSFSFSTSPSNEYSGLISFRMDWLDLLAVQGTLKSLLQHHSSKAWILWRSAFFIVQLSHPYMTTGKAIALTRWTFVGKVMSLLFNTLSRLVIMV